MPSRHQGPERERRALDAYVKLLRASDALAAQAQRSLAVHGLGLAQLGVLEALLHLGPLAQRELCAKLLRSDGSISLVVDALERRGWVRRERDARDKRRRNVRLSPAGRRKIQGVFPHHAAQLTHSMEALNATELETLGRLCKRLGLSVSSSAQPLPIPHSLNP